MKLSIRAASFAGLLGISFARSALGADCATPPAPGEAIFYRYANRGGDCLRVGSETGRISGLQRLTFYRGPWYYPIVLTWDDRIASVWLGLGTRASLYRDGNFQGPMADYLGAPWGGYQWYNLVNPGEASSLVVSRIAPTPIPFVYAGEYPTKTGTGWSYKAQGIAHDDDRIYLTRSTQIFAVPRSLDLNTLGDYYYRNPLGAAFVTREQCAGSGFDASACTLVNQLPPDVRVYEVTTLAQRVLRPYDHFGDPDFWNGYLFVPVESNAGDSPLVAVFDSSLNLVAWDWLYAARADAGGMRHGAFITVSPAGVLITSGERLDANNGLHKYQLNAAEIPHNGWFIDFVEEQTLFHSDPTVADGSATGPLVPVNLPIPQGADLSDWDSDLIYITNGCCRDTSGPWGLRAFHLSTGAAQAESANGYGAFNYAFSSLEEPEGVDFWDTDTLASPLPGFPRSQLHVQVTSDGLQSTRLKHYVF